MKLPFVLISMIASMASAKTMDIIPEPTSVSVPDLSHSSDPEIVANGWKYFFFLRPGVSYAEAYTDIFECYRFLQPVTLSGSTVPQFVPWTYKTAGTRGSPQTSNFGLVGAAIGGLVEGTLDRRDRQSKMRRCMEPKGYTRYGVAENIWTSVTSLETAQSIATQAKIASNPPFGGKVPTK